MVMLIFDASKYVPKLQECCSFKNDLIAIFSYFLPRDFPQKLIIVHLYSQTSFRSLIYKVYDINGTSQSTINLFAIRVSLCELARLTSWEYTLQR